MCRDEVFITLQFYEKRKRERERKEREIKRERLTASPLVSSHLPNTELAAAKTEHRELRVVVIPAWSGRRQHLINNHMTVM